MLGLLLWLSDARIALVVAYLARSEPAVTEQRINRLCTPHALLEDQSTTGPGRLISTHQ